MIKRIISAVLCLILTFAIVPAAFAGGDLDSTAPTVDRAEILTNSVEKPGTVSISLDVTEVDTGVTSIFVALYTYNDGQLRYFYKTTDFLPRTQFSGTVIVDIPVSQTEFPGTYRLGELTITDAAGNPRNYFEGWPEAGYSNNGTEYYIPCSGDPDIQCIIVGAGTVEVTGVPGEDLIAPTVNKATLQTVSVQKPGTVSLLLDVTEADTGITSIIVSLYAYNDGQLRFFYKATDFLPGTQFSGTVIVDIPVSQTEFPGAYRIGELTITDAAGNPRNYFDGWPAEGYMNDGRNNYITCAGNTRYKCIIEGTGTVQINGIPGEDTVAPTVNSATILTPNVQKPGTVSIALDVTEAETGITDLSVAVYAYNGGILRTFGKIENYTAHPKRSGTIIVDIPVPLTAYLSTYRIGNIHIRDKAGNPREYFDGWPKEGYNNDGANNYISCIGNSSIKCIMGAQSTFDLVYDYDVDLAASATDWGLTDQIAGLAEGKAAMVYVNFAYRDICTKEMLDAIKGKDKTIVFYYDNIQWAFYGKDIVNPTKDVHMSVSTHKLSGEQYGLGGDVLKLEFYSNGVLPGPVTVRVQSDEISKVFGDSETMYLYYLNNGTPVPQTSSVRSFVNGYDEWCKFSVAHNSTFLISRTSASDMVPPPPLAPAPPPHVGTFQAKRIPSKALAGTAITIVPPAVPKGHTMQSVTYTSSNPSIATVDANGNVTFVGGGKATIIIRAVSQTVDKKGRVKTKTTTIKKTITVNQPVASITLNIGDTTIARTRKVKLIPAFAPATASNKKVKWTTSNKKVATVSSSGVVTGKAGGTAVITCRAQDGSGALASCTVTVTPIHPTGLRMSKAALTIKTGKTSSLKATVAPKNTDFKTVTWTSSNPGIASVDAKGKIKGLAPGVVTITATTSNGLSASCTVTVQ